MPIDQLTAKHLMPNAAGMTDCNDQRSRSVGSLPYTLWSSAGYVLTFYAHVKNTRINNVILFKVTETDKIT